MLMRGQSDGDGGGYGAEQTPARLAGQVRQQRRLSRAEVCRQRHSQPLGLADPTLQMFADEGESAGRVEAVTPCGPDTRIAEVGQEIEAGQVRRFPMQPRAGPPD